MLLTVTVIYFLIGAVCAENITCMLPTDPPDASCPSAHEDCHTLNEWIENGTSHFTSNTTVVLLPGLHLINSTKDKLQMSNLHSVHITGQRGETVVTCLYDFGLYFYNIGNVRVTNITFRSCAFNQTFRKTFYKTFTMNVTLLLYAVQNVSVTNVRITGSGIVVFGMESYKRSTFQLQDSTIYSKRTGVLFHSRNMNENTKNHGDRVYIKNCSASFVFSVSQFVFSDPSLTFSKSYECSIASIDMVGVAISDMTNSLALVLIECSESVSLTNITFLNNPSPLLYASARLIELKGLIQFTGNTGDYGAVLHSKGTVSVCRGSKIVFSDNHVKHNLFHIHIDIVWLNNKLNKVQIISAEIVAKNNQAVSAGGIMILEIRGEYLYQEPQNNERFITMFNSSFKFENNTVNSDDRHYSGILILTGNTYNSEQINDIIIITKITYDIRSLNFLFKNNTINSINNDYSGIIILTENSTNQITKITYNTHLLNFTFENNIVYSTNNDNAGIMIVKNSQLKPSWTKILFSNNTSPSCGALMLINSEITSESIFVEFSHNHGGDGGGMALYERSHVTCTGYRCHFLFYYNTASKRGGGLFIKDSDNINSFTHILVSHPFYFKTKGSLTKDLSFEFVNNHAELAGNDIYGGWIDATPSYIPTVLFSNESQTDLSRVASDPTRICMCIDSVPDCSINEHKVELFPGQTFEVEAVAVGQRKGVVPSTVLAQFSDEEGHLGNGQDVQSVGRECTNLQFTVYSLKGSKNLKLTPSNDGIPNFDRSLQNSLPQEYHILFQQFSISVTLNNCPKGFEFNKQSKSCLCSPLIDVHKKYGIDCNLNTFGILRTKDVWLQVTSEHTVPPHRGILVHNHCPYDYCQSDADTLTFHLETPDDQCAFNRSRLLCGACRANLSQVLGTSMCRQCSDVMLSVIIPATIIAGILLVAFLMTLNLTVSIGTINGLIFYANIVRASQAVFFPPEISTSFLSIFIAWLNLDLGIETCFYDGLDAYAKTWLQFVFPLYIWIMVITIIVASHYSSTVSRLFGNNAVQVLATLFLLSYAKILRAVITVFSFTVLVYPDGYVKKVWLLDGNLEFLIGKHIPLFIASLLLFLLLSVPYTLSLVSIQVLQRISHYRVLFWVHRLMPLFDAYTGPYKHKHRYWTGLLLLVRVLFLLIFSVNYSNDPAVNLLAITVITFTMLVYLSYMRVYKHWYHNSLEIVFFLNLGLLSVSTVYQLLTSAENQALATNISASISFVLFILVIFQHAVQRVLSIKRIKTAIEHHGKGLEDDIDSESQSNHSPCQSKCAKIMHTSIEMREPLIHEQQQ